MTKKIKLEEGECLCPKCNGVGEVYTSKGIQGNTICTKCWGAGKLDWIEMIMGASYIFHVPRLRKVYPQLIAKELVKVQPMGMPQAKKENKKQRRI
jgi:hypothetical protein